MNNKLVNKAVGIIFAAMFLFLIFNIIKWIRKDNSS